MTAQLRALLPEWHVALLAVDETTTFDIECRNPDEHPWSTYQRSRDEVYDALKQQDLAWYNAAAESGETKYTVSQDDGFIHSFRNLAELTQRRDLIVRLVVLSIGGNDLYLRPEIQLELMRSLVPCRGHLRKRVAVDFGQRYHGILTAIRTVAPSAQILPVIPYHPHVDFPLVSPGSVLYGLPSTLRSCLGLFSSACLHRTVTRLQQWVLPTLVTPMVQELLRAVAATNRDALSGSTNGETDDKGSGLPVPAVVDLSKTFDPTNASEYGTGNPTAVNAFGVDWSGVEPSCKSSRYIAELIAAAAVGEQSSKTTCELLWLGRESKARISLTLTRSTIASYRFGPVVASPFSCS